MTIIYYLTNYCVHYILQSFETSYMKTENYKQANRNCNGTIKYIAHTDNANNKNIIVENRKMEPVKSI